MATLYNASSNNKHTQHAFIKNIVILLLQIEIHFKKILLFILSVFTVEVKNYGTATKLTASHP